MDTRNRHLVGILGSDVVIGVPVMTRRLSADEAMMFAAWLVSMAQIVDRTLPPFDTYIRALEAT